jgi:hypothetical protein
MAPQPASEPHIRALRHAKTSLTTRAGVARTFGSLGGFVAILFLGAGAYLLQETLSDPLRAQAIGLIAGAFIIVLATMLIYFIFSPRKKLQSEKTRRRRSAVRTEITTIVIPAQPANAQKEADEDLAVHA